MKDELPACSEAVLDIISLWAPHAVPVAHIVNVCEIFGYTGNSVRVTLHRLTNRGTLENLRVEGRTLYGFAPQTARLNRHVRAASSLRSREVWDGRWLQLLISIPEKQRGARQRIRRALGVFHFGSPYRGVWTRPNNLPMTPASLRRELVSLGAAGSLDILLSSFCEVGREAELVESLWQPKIRARALQKGVRRVEKSLANLARKSEKAALADTFATSRIAVRLLFDDPLLPDEFLPRQWPGYALRSRFAEFRQVSGKLWADYVRHEPGSAGLDSSHLRSAFDDVVFTASLPDYGLGIWDGAGG